MTLILKFVWKNYLTEANFNGIFDFFKLKWVPVIEFLKYLECLLFKHKTWIGIIKCGCHNASKFGIT